MKPLTENKYESVYISKGKILACWVVLQTTDNHVLSKEVQNDSNSRIHTVADCGDVVTSLVSVSCFFL